MQIILTELPASQQALYPLNLACNIAEVRWGLFTIQEWYGLRSGTPALVAEWGSEMIHHHLLPAAVETVIWVNAAIAPDEAFFHLLESLTPGKTCFGPQGWLAAALPRHMAPWHFSASESSRITISDSFIWLTHPMDLVKNNADRIESDGRLAMQKGGYMPFSHEGNFFTGTHGVYAAPGAQAWGCFFNTSAGPVFLGKNALVMEGTCIRGPVAIGENAVVKMGAQLYGGTTIGRFCTAGGEIKNAILGDFSNKAHHGYLGDSIVGRWCNLGAGTSNSNVKNNAGEVHMWTNAAQSFVSVGSKGGMVMGDFSKTAIHTAINTGTTIGLGCSIHTAGWPNKHIPSFSWGPGNTYAIGKLLRDISAWCAFKGVSPSPEMLARIQQLYKGHIAA